MGDYPDWTRLFFLTGTSITLDINITGVDVTMPVSIEASTVTLDVSISAATVTVNINFSDQSVAVLDIFSWASQQGTDKFWYSVVQAPTGVHTYLNLYTVPTGKALYVDHLSVTNSVQGFTELQYISPQIVFEHVAPSAWTTVIDQISPPVVVSAGKTLRLHHFQQFAALETFWSMVRAYEIAV
jgi:hypothetical protein